MVNGEEPSAADAVPLRRARPDGPDQAGGGESPGPATAATAANAANAATAATAATANAADAAGDGPAAPPVRHRRTPPHRIAVTAARRAAGWARRPRGRLALVGLFIVALLALTGAAGAYLVPAGAPVGTPRPAAQDSNAPAQASASAAGSAPTTLPSAGPQLMPSGTPVPSSSAGNPVGAAGARPADALSGWAQHMAGLVDVPQVALQAYGYAELVATQSTGGCHLSWTTLAAIGKVESNHGSFSGSTLYPDGQALPAIIGPPLDGKAGRRPVADTDHGELDNDIRWDHAVGPMQFIPSTWRSQAVDADNDGIRNPNDIDDAALAAANYLCSGGRDLATATGWWDAIAAYNMPRTYGEKVFTAANEYGTRSQG